LEQNNRSSILPHLGNVPVNTTGGYQRNKRPISVSITVATD